MLEIEEFLDLQSKVDRFFEFMDALESKHLKMVSIRLKSVADVRWTD